MKSVASVTPTLQPAQPAGWVTQKLKAERVQEELAALMAVRLTRRQVADRLPLLPGWRLAGEGRELEQVRDFGTHAVASLYGSFVSGFADSVGISAAVEVVGPQALVRLYATRSRGRVGALSEGILGFAKLVG
jgi:hypothetical protein